MLHEAWPCSVPQQACPPSTVGDTVSDTVGDTVVDTVGDTVGDTASENRTCAFFCIPTLTLNISVMQGHTHLKVHTQVVQCVHYQELKFQICTPLHYGDTHWQRNC